MVDLSLLTQLLLPHLSLVPATSLSLSVSLFWLSSSHFLLSFLSLSSFISHFIPVANQISRSPYGFFPFMALYEWNERREGGVCPCVCQAKLFLPDVSLCFILPSATLSACHRQIRSSGACICVCLRRGE